MISLSMRCFQPPLETLYYDLHDETQPGKMPKPRAIGISTSWASQHPEVAVVAMAGLI
jgi:hypothetical protein